jgi:hypothetical protein
MGGGLQWYRLAGSHLSPLATDMSFSPRTIDSTIFMMMLKDFS